MIIYKKLVKSIIDLTSFVFIYSILHRLYPLYSNNATVVSMPREQYLHIRLISY